MENLEDLDMDDMLQAFMETTQEDVMYNLAIMAPPAAQQLTATSASSFFPPSAPATPTWIDPARSDPGYYWGEGAGASMGLQQQQFNFTTSASRSFPSPLSQQQSPMPPFHIQQQQLIMQQQQLQKQAMQVSRY